MAQDEKETSSAPSSKSRRDGSFAKQFHARTEFDQEDVQGAPEPFRLKRGEPLKLVSGGATIPTVTGCLRKTHASYVASLWCQCVAQNVCRSCWDCIEPACACACACACAWFGMASVSRHECTLAQTATASNTHSHAVHVKRHANT
jgi:hypothetical protein